MCTIVCRDYHIHYTAPQSCPSYCPNLPTSFCSGWRVNRLQGCAEAAAEWNVLPPEGILQSLKIPEICMKLGAALYMMIRLVMLFKFQNEGLRSHYVRLKMIYQGSIKVKFQLIIHFIRCHWREVKIVEIWSLYITKHVH